MAKIRKAVICTLLIVVLILAIVIPILIVFTQPDGGSPEPADPALEKRIACYPLLELGDSPSLNRTFCENRGCVWDDMEDNGGITRCYLPPDGSNSYGYEVLRSQKLLLSFIITAI